MVDLGVRRRPVRDLMVMSGAGGATDPGGRRGFQWDVALSFASAQRGYVEQVAEALKARGVRCFYDADEQIDLWGKYLAEELPTIYGEQAAVVVVFVSAEYAAQDWTRLERRAALNRAVRERQEYVLPARFDDTPLPGLLSDIVTVDLRARSPQQFAAMIAEKLDALFIAAPAPSGGAGGTTEGAGRRAGAPVLGWTNGATGPQAQPRRSSVAPPWGLLPLWVRGRDDLIEELCELVASPDGRIHVLSGLGGNGKTTVALAVADRAQATGRVWWISARDRPSLDSGLLDLANALGITSEQLEQARIGIRSLLDLIWEQLNAAQAWVLVVDNADSPELLATDEGQTRDGNGVARGSTRGLTVVTSRTGSQEVWGSRAVIHIVDPLHIQDGADVLLDLCGESAGSKQDAVALAERLGGLPLALRAAGLYLSRRGGVGCGCHRDASAQLATARWTGRVFAR
jgi:hypothetical protein